jgi:uncharacterized Ntn-hydrolase superfamily protein
MWTRAVKQWVAIATQALANLSYGPNDLTLLRSGLTASETVARLIGDDPLVHQRQLAIVDAEGRTANHTGRRCMDWKGHRPGEDFTAPTSAEQLRPLLVIRRHLHRHERCARN